MSKIESLLDEDTRQKLQSYVVVKASTDPNPPRTLTEADAIEIDPESEAMIDALCVDCQVPVLIDPRLPDGEVDERPRVPICADCAKIRARFSALRDRRNVEVIRRTRVARYSPRMTDNIDHPVVTTTKENDVIDLDNLSDAELGATVRQDLKASMAAEIPAKRAKAKKAKRKADAEALEGVKANQKRRKGHILKGFTYGTKVNVPDLDLSDVVDLNEMVSATLRSPYNMARFHIAGEGPLWAPAKEDEDGYFPTTYAVLESEHGRLMALATIKEAEKAAKAAEKAKPKAKAKKEKVQVVAVLDAAEEAVLAQKVKALRKVTGLDKATARAIVLASA